MPGINIYSTAYTDAAVGPEALFPHDNMQTFNEAEIVTGGEDEDIPLGLQRMRARLLLLEANEKVAIEAIERARKEALSAKRAKFEKIRQQGIKTREKMRKREENKEKVFFSLAMSNFVSVPADTLREPK